MAQERVNAGHKIPEEMNVIIQIPSSHDPIKYIVDKESGALFVASFHNASMHYPCNYGYIPNTLDVTGLPLNVLVITPLPVNQGCVIRCRPLGVLALVEDAKIIRKIVAVPIHRLTDAYHHVQKIDDLPHALVQKIIHFFTHYKELDQTQSVNFEGWLSIESAKREILTGVLRHEKQTEAIV
ncbi:MAG: inorganic diphosphatase [Proteobacteria bacterium]|nr:inorganic diphosphatase [Pseudomonadota bacterium]